MNQDPKTTALRVALQARDPFYTGICAIPGYQRFLYYTDYDVLRRIDFSNASTEALEGLYGACKPAEFGLNGETHYDYLEEALANFSNSEAEAFVFVGQRNKPYRKELKRQFVGRFYKEPFTEVLEVTEMRSSVDTCCSMVSYGNEAQLDYFYGTTCMVIAVEPAESRKPIGP